MQHFAGNQFLSLARQFSANSMYSKAFDMYVFAFDKWPEFKNVAEMEFRALVENFNEYLLASQKIADIFYNFERSMECFPGNMFILNDIGRYLFMFGYYKEACNHFQKALNVNIGYVSAEKNMNSVKNAMVAPWHFRMLNDKIRNNAYREAIHEIVRPVEDTVLDVGTGTGLLALYASECRPSLIAACDSSETMIEIAGCVLQNYNVDNAILLNKISTSLDEHSIGGKHSTMVTELFDAALFGEQVLQTLEHAWINLLAPDARIIPVKAEFFVVGAKCDFLSSKYRIKASVLSLLEIPSSHVHVASMEPYDTEDVSLYKDLKYITEPQIVLNVKFNSLEDIREKLTNENPYEVSLKAVEDGEIDIIIGWFNLHLTDNVVITTDPRDKKTATAWQQAIFYDFLPKTVKKDDLLTFKFSSFNGRLCLLSDYKVEIDRVSPKMIRFLHDSDYIRIITLSVGAVFIHLSQIVDEFLINILDLNPFPVLGLMLMKRGAQSLTCYAKSNLDRDFILKVFKENGISESSINIILDDELSVDYFTDQKYHIISYNLLDLCGDMNVNQKQILNKVKQSHLLTGGLILPFRVTLQGQLIYSDWLENHNLVKDENLNDFKIANYINKYQVSQLFHIDIAHLNYKAFTEVTPIAICSEEMPSKVIEMKVTEEGVVNSILCWYSIELIEKGEIFTTRKTSSYVDSIAFRAHPKIPIKMGENVNILRCVDNDDSFKLITDVE